MPWSAFQMAYLAMIVSGFGLFMLVLGVTAIVCGLHRPPPPHEALQVEEGGLKAHGDKLAHSTDIAA